MKCAVRQKLDLLEVGSFRSRNDGIVGQSPKPDFRVDLRRNLADRRDASNILKPYLFRSTGIMLAPTSPHSLSTAVVVIGNKLYVYQLCSANSFNQQTRNVDLQYNILHIHMYILTYICIYYTAQCTIHILVLHSICEIDIVGLYSGSVVL